jgi:hypothetical protein
MSPAMNESVNDLIAEFRRLRTANVDLAAALVIAEAALSDIGDADREPGDDVAWCERRASIAIPIAREALAKHKKETL